MPSAAGHHRETPERAAWCHVLRVASACVAAAAVAGAMAPSAHAGVAPTRTRYVDTARAFEAAVAADRDTGGTIVLLPGIYTQPLVIGPRQARRLRIVGSARAVVRSLRLDHTRSVTVRGLSIRAGDTDGGVLAFESQHLVLRGLRFSAKGTTHRVSLDLNRSRHVVVRNSDFSHCGDHTPQWSMCLYPRYASSLTVENNVFHDCRGCDFIHGRAGPYFTVRDNRFMRALKCTERWVKCGHSDLIELFAADHMTVSRNVFGVNQIGGAQLYLTATVDHVRVIDNLFLRHDPKAPGVVPRVGVLVGGRINRRVPHDVEIANNTILSGKPLPDGACHPKCPRHAASSIVLSRRYSQLPRAQRPIIANNVIGRLLEPAIVCAQARVSIRNVVERGTACSATDAVANPRLNRYARPTAASAMLIDRGAARYAPRTDLLPHRRVGPPDIGAYEYSPGCGKGPKCEKRVPRIG